MKKFTVTKIEIELNNMEKAVSKLISMCVSNTISHRSAVQYIMKVHTIKIQQAWVAALMLGIIIGYALSLIKIALT